MTFRFKLLLAMMSVVLGVTGATLLVTKKKVESVYANLFDQQSSAHIDFFNALQETRLNNIKERCLGFAPNVRLREIMLELNEAIALQDQDDIADFAADLYETAEHELREFLGQTSEGKVQAEFFSFFDESGNLIAAPGQSGGAMPTHTLARFDEALAGDAAQQTGCIAFEINGRKQLLEVVFTKITDVRDGRVLGALVLGFPVPFGNERNSPIKSGIWLDGEIFSGGIPQAIRPLLAGQIASSLTATSRSRGELVLEKESVPVRVFYEPLNPSASFPPAYQVCVYSMADEIAEQRSLQWTIVAFGTAGLAVALLVSLLLSHGLTVPLLSLVRATEEIQQGNFDVRVPVRNRDETGRLAGSFNEMAQGLALKEKYRGVLDMVADKAVAHDLMNGNLALGGEVREVSVLFCDIRGFTALTAKMDPTEVIAMLNEHMTTLTRVVYENQGVVDKFVGDLIMAVFGAPKSYTGDAYNAVRAAARMIEERTKLNQISRYNIEVGIGIATGPVVAGRMGSETRLNYTVLGERVNLAARLCSKAGRMETVIDCHTRELLETQITVEALEELHLKGFAEPVRAFKLIEVQPPGGNHSNYRFDPPHKTALTTHNSAIQS